MGAVYVITLLYFLYDVFLQIPLLSLSSMKLVDFITLKGMVSSSLLLFATAGAGPPKASAGWSGESHR